MSSGGANRGKGAGVSFLRANIDYDGEDCLLWPMSRDWDGYGTLGFEGKVVRAHRWMCEAVNGSPPSPKHYAAHDCGKGHLGCVTPKHLAWKTQDENALDSIRHGTARTGKGRRLRKLTHAQVLEIIALKGTKTHLELGIIYGVHQRHIRLIQSGGSWNGALPRKTGKGNLVHEAHVMTPIGSAHDLAQC